MFRVLVIDDDNTIIFFMSRLLKNKFDCQVLSAENGLEALTILEDKEIDLIFLDVTMPVMDGIETLRAIRASETLKNIPVVMLSAIADRNVIDEVKELNIHSYMLKPLTYETAYKAIKKILDQILLDRINANSFDTLIESEVDGREKIVIIDPDEYFKEEFRLKLSEEFVIFDSDSGAKGLNIILTEKPDYIFIAENLSTLNEKFIAQKIKRLAEQSELSLSSANDFDFTKMQVYLIKNIDENTDPEKELMELSEEEKYLFDEVFVKSDEPDVLLRGLSKALKF